MSIGNYTLADAQAHAEKHGYKLEFANFRASYGDELAIRAVEKNAKAAEKMRKSHEPNKTEAEFGRILEAMKLRGELVEYRYQGIKLSWGHDPDTDKPMWYTPDWFVIAATHLDCLKEFQLIKVIEVKGAKIWDRDIVRFKGARAAWPMFAFEMHQKKAGEWRRLH